jgi:hypothetical protein
MTISHDLFASFGDSGKSISLLANNEYAGDPLIFLVAVSPIPFH